MKSLIVFLLLCGCSTMTVTTPEGYHASYTRFGDQQIEGFLFEKDALGITHVSFAKQGSDAKLLDAIKLLLGASQ